MRNTGNPLPEKCCAKCGFLYGMASTPASSDDAEFDPDLIRLEDYPPQGDRGYRQGVITSQHYVSQMKWWMLGKSGPEYKVEPPKVQLYRWADTIAICCDMKKFRPIAVTGQAMAEKYIRNPDDWVPFT